MNNKLIPIVLTLVVGIILAGSVLVPVLNDAQKDIGPKVSYDNTPIDSNYKFLGTDEALEITLTKNGDTGLWDVEINGETYTTTADQNLTLLYSDALSMNKNANGTAIEINYGNGEIIASYATKTITFENGVVTLEIPTASFSWTGTYSWVYIWNNDGTWINHAGSYSAYVSSINDLVCGGSYTTGENDCFYSIKDGVLSITGDYEHSFTYNLTKVEGTTDVYELSSLVITVGDETFTPFRTLVPETITGHEASGASYSLLGAIPVMVIVALIMGAVGMIVVKRND